MISIRCLPKVRDKTHCSRVPKYLMAISSKKAKSPTNCLRDNSVPGSPLEELLIYPNVNSPNKPTLSCIRRRNNNILLTESSSINVSISISCSVVIIIKIGYIRIQGFPLRKISLYGLKHFITHYNGNIKKHPSKEKCESLASSSLACCAMIALANMKNFEINNQGEFTNLDRLGFGKYFKIHQAISLQSLIAWDQGGLSSVSII
ncbi:unnamed protein product [Moneuplotes crassus]|uniref:Uncharacterized protein n=1 Tax=Euplotes crassus TaxID=5936 RepID=A0AAD1UBA9_EUPCR|nr:unnamed protein product [Moneuplotes crassus]